MKDKFKNYFPLIDYFNFEQKADVFSENDTEEEEIFKYFFPMNITLLMRYLQNTIDIICEKFVEKEKISQEIEKLKTIAKSSEENKMSEYKWKDIDLVELLKGDYNYLKEKFVLKVDYIPDNKSYINNFSFPISEHVFPFSIKEIYHALLERAIDVTISNYYSIFKRKI